MRTCLILASEFPPKNTAGVHRTLRFCQFLPRFGWTPRVLTMDVEEPGGDKLMSKISGDLEVIRVGPSLKSSKNAVAVTTSGKPVHNRLSRIKALLRPLSQLITETPDRNVGWSRLAEKRGRELLSRQPVDALYSSGPPHSVHLAARRLALAFKIPWVADFRDPWARRPWSTTQNPWGRKFIPMLERQVVETASAVILNTPTSCADFSAAYPKLAHKFHCIPNGLDADLLASVREISATARSENNVPILCHPGGLYGHRDPSNTLKAIAALNAQGVSIKFQQIGAIAEHFQPQKLADELGISQLFEAIPSLSHRDTLQAMHHADMLLIIQPDAPLMVPSKVYEMLAFDRPVVAVCDSPCTETVVKEAGGFAAPSRDVPAIVCCLREAWQCRSDTNRSQQRETARAKYDGCALTKTLADLLTAVTDQAEQR